MIIKIITILSFMGVGVLAYFGYNMGALATSGITKIHPISYIVILYTIMNMIFNTNHISKTSQIFIRNKIEFTLIGIVFSTIFLLSILSKTSSLSFLIDTLITPALIAIAFRSFSFKEKLKIEYLALALIIINSLIAIIERITNFNNFPINFTYGEIFRSTALLGHPLNNALITLVFILYILNTNIKFTKKILLLSLLIVAEICFGARGSLMISLLSILIFLVGPILLDSKVHNRGYYLLMIFLMIIGIVSLTFYTTLGERLLKVSYYDSSSAVRSKALNLINLNELSNYYLPKSDEEINVFKDHEDIGIIENFFIQWIYKFGLIFALLLVIILYVFLFKKVVKKSLIKAHLIVSLFFIAALTNNSLAANTNVISIFVIIFSFNNNYKSNQLRT